MTPGFLMATERLAMGGWGTPPVSDPRERRPSGVWVRIKGRRAKVGVTGAPRILLFSAAVEVALALAARP